MITPATLDALYRLRKDCCTCGAVMNTPAFHEDACPFRARGAAAIEAAERDNSHAEHE